MAQISAPSGRGSRRSLHIDMTPMVDLAFLLLTFFVLTMTINKKYALEIVKPEEDNTQDPPKVKQERVLTFLLGDDDRIYYFLGNDPVQITHYGETGIRKILTDARSTRSDLVLLVKPMSTSRYQNLVDILDEVHNAELKDYYIVKETPEDRALILKAG